jgi:hypothetical protein
MITRCPYCSYAKPEQPLSLPILAVLNEPDLPEEDRMLWTHRLVMHQGLKDYRSISVHVGMMHKDKPNIVVHDLTEQEQDIINKAQIPTISF